MPLHEPAVGSLSASPAQPRRDTLVPPLRRRLQRRSISSNISQRIFPRKRRGGCSKEREQWHGTADHGVRKNEWRDGVGTGEGEQEEAIFRVSGSTARVKGPVAGRGEADANTLLASFSTSRTQSASQWYLDELPCHGIRSLVSLGQAPGNYNQLRCEKTKKSNEFINMKLFTKLAVRFYIQIKTEGGKNSAQ